MINATVSRQARVRRSGEDRGGLFLVIAAPISAALVLTGTCPPILHIAAGLFLLFGLPVALVNAKINWPESTKLHEALLYSLALVLLGIIVGGLAINEVLPYVGVARPLDRIPVVVTLLIALSALAAWRRERWRPSDGISAANRAQTPVVIGSRDQTLLVVGVIIVIGSVAGALRLNNGAGSSVTVAMLMLAAVAIIAVFSWRGRLQESTVLVTIYLLSASLLLMTSLRGWLVTGHDIQREFGMFELVSSHGVWNIDVYRDAYNACLSVTILPTIIERTTGISDVYIYKTVFQLLYALCPVLIYLIARRFSSKSVAILGAVYVIAFPTFFTDMPFLNRQEVAFFFLGIALLLVTDERLPIRTRRLGFLASGVGIILSHYSTTYVLLGVLALGWIFTSVASTAGKLSEKLRTAQGRQRHHPRAATPRPTVVNWVVILTLAALTLLWVGPVTGSGGVVKETLTSTVNSLKDLGSGQRSADASYSIFGGEKPSPQQRLEEYRTAAIENTGQGRKDQGHYPLEAVERYPTPVVAADQLPVTAAGNAVERIGVDVSTVNRLLRSGATIMLQFFVGLGFLLVLLGRARGFRPSHDFLTWAAACIVIITLHVLLPNVSVNYGILRTFAQGLFWLAPFLGVGSIQAFSWLGRSVSIKAALGATSVFFLSLTGVISQLLGGYPPQLHLNNSGQYYDIYYQHSSELSAMTWLQSRIATDTTSQVQSEVTTDRYAIQRLRNYSEVNTPTDDIFPILMRKGAYAFLGYTTVHKGQVTSLISGDLVTYEYPIDFLDANKNLIYSSNGAKIYR
jgi:uncharacterized membrane protein